MPALWRRWWCYGAGLGIQRVRRGRNMLTSLLIGWFGKRAGVALARLLPYLLAVLAVVGIGWLIYDKGYDRGVNITEQKYQTAIEEERHRQIEANDEALQAAMERQRELERLLEERDAEIADILREAEEDPDAGRRAINSDSGQRINRVR